MTWLAPYPDSWLEAPATADPGPEARVEAHEAVELAFIAALQRLPPRQTAVVILVDVLGFSSAEVAGILGGSATAAKGALQRARASLARDRGPGRHDPLDGRGSAAEHALARRFATAFSAGDVDGLLSPLADEAWLAMPPAPHEYLGPGAIGAFLRASTDWRAHRALTLVSTRANGQLAFGCYLSDPGAQIGAPTGVVVLTVSGDRISQITRFLDDQLPRRFGLASPTR